MQKAVCLLVTVALIASAGAAMALTLDYETPNGLTGTQEVPPNLSNGSGTGTVHYDPVQHLLDVLLNFTGLTAPASAAHIHVGSGPGTAGPVAVNFTGFPFGQTSGTYQHTFDLTQTGTYGATFLTNSGGTAAGAEATLAAALDAGHAYMNIHNSVFPGGEIRGDLAAVPAPVPEPSTLALVAAGAIAALGLGRRRRSAARA